MSQELSRIDALFAKIDRRSEASGAASAVSTVGTASSHANRADQIEADTLPQQQVTPSEWARIMREWIDSFEQAMNETGHADLTGTFEEMHEAFYAYAAALHEEAAKTKGD